MACEVSAIPPRSNIGPSPKCWLSQAISSECPRVDTVEDALSQWPSSASTGSRQAPIALTATPPTSSPAESVAEQRARQPDELSPPDRIGIMFGPTWPRQAESMLDRRLGQHLAVRRAEHALGAVGADIDAQQ